MRAAGELADKGGDRKSPGRSTTIGAPADVDHRCDEGWRRLMMYN
jgi:hypothetical protein